MIFLVVWLLVQIGVFVWLSLPLLGVWPGPFGYAPAWDVFRLHENCEHPECLARRAMKEIDKRGVVDWALSPEIKTVDVKVKPGPHKSER